MYGYCSKPMLFPLFEPIYFQGCQRSGCSRCTKVEATEPPHIVKLRPWLDLLKEISRLLQSVRCPWELNAIGGTIAGAARFRCHQERTSTLVTPMYVGTVLVRHLFRWINRCNLGYREGRAWTIIEDCTNRSWLPGRTIMRILRREIFRSRNGSHCDFVN